MNKYSVMCVASYLLAIVTANGLVSYFGQPALPFTAFILIPFDLMARDVLHEKWRSSYLWYRMFALITAGSLISFVTTISSAQVATASAVAFMCTGVTDAVFYYLLDRFPRFVKMNGSNLFSSIVDSIVFPLVAFGALIPSLSAAQAASKFFGGIVWTILFLEVFYKIEEPVKTETCDHCGGYGWYGDLVHCKRCNGTGVI